MGVKEPSKKKQEKQGKTPILFGGDPLPTTWTVEDADRQWARMPGTVYSGIQGLRNHGLLD